MLRYTFVCYVGVFLISIYIFCNIVLEKWSSQQNAVSDCMKKIEELKKDLDTKDKEIEKLKKQVEIVNKLEQDKNKLLKEV